MTKNGRGSNHSFPPRKAVCVGVRPIFNTQWDVDGNVDLIELGFYDWAVNRWEITQSSLPETNNTLEIRCS